MVRLSMVSIQHFHCVSLGCGLQNVSYRIPGFHEQFSGVLQAYLVYSKIDKILITFNYIIYFLPHLVHNWHWVYFQCKSPIINF
jgi:hypothetical protein